MLPIVAKQSFASRITCCNSLTTVAPPTPRQGQGKQLFAEIDMKRRYSSSTPTPHQTVGKLCPAPPPPFPLVTVLRRRHGMAGPEVVSKDTLEALRSLLGVVEGKGEGDRPVWRVRATPLRTSVAWLNALDFACLKRMATPAVGSAGDRKTSLRNRIVM